MKLMDEEKILRILFIREERARKQHFTPNLLEIGLTPGQGQARVLSILLVQDRSTQKDLSDRCHMDTTTMSRNIDRLEKLGLLVREQNPDSRRSYLICLTDLGREKAQDIQQLFDHYEDVLGDGIEADEMEQFKKTLLKVCQNLEKSLDGE
jgi:MarR family transcriptional regulator for hemolysin